MNPAVTIPQALCLPAPDIEALIQGQTVVALPLKIRQGQQFALYPTPNLRVQFSLENYYRPVFLPTATQVINEMQPDPVLIKAWAKCEFCQIIAGTEGLDTLSKITIWTTEALEEIVRQRQSALLAYLRVYKLSHFLEIPVQADVKIGQFIGLPEPITISSFLPSLEDTHFESSKQRILERQPPLHRDLEELLVAVNYQAVTEPSAKLLASDIQSFINRTPNNLISELSSDLEWIKMITTTGNSRDGTTFEKLVRRSFLKLGFTNSERNLKASLNSNTTGGAGGLDFYCEFPYPIVGECKASGNKSIPTDVCSQLTYLAQTHVGAEVYLQSIRIIVGVGSLNSYSRNVAIGNKMNVIRPQTLQRLVELKTRYSGAIDLFELKPCLEQQPYGEEADTKVNQYIDKAWERIKVRSQIIQSVQELCEPSNHDITVTEARVQYNARFAPNSEPKLNDEQVRDLLIELSSPLTGYLGRKRDEKGDRFYYLRDLPFEPTLSSL